MARPVHRRRLFSRSLGYRVCLPDRQWRDGLYSFNIWAGGRIEWARFSACPFGNIRAERNSRGNSQVGDYASTFGKLGEDKVVTGASSEWPRRAPAMYSAQPR